MGIDVGTTGVKALAVSTAGEVLARAEEPYPLTTPHTASRDRASAGPLARSRASIGLVASELQEPATGLHLCYHVAGGSGLRPDAPGAKESGIRPFGDFDRTRKDEMTRDYDPRTGRPQVDGRDVVEALTDAELEAELTIAAGQPNRRASRLAALVAERTRRRLSEGATSVQRRRHGAT